LGQIGREIAVRAQAFGMRVVAWSRSLTHEEADRLGVTYAQTPLDVARLADVVSINVSANAETKHLVDAEFLGAMRPGAYLINTSRGSVVDEAALERALKAGSLGAAGIDVYEREPAIHPELLAAPNAVLLPHIGSASRDTRRRMAERAAQNILAFLEGRPLLDPVA
jgi:glyoxylate reductase